MKKPTFILASLLMLVALKTNAQNERMLLLESFTNTSCGWCAVYNPDMDALIANNPDKIVAIKYHVNWPGPNDPMYLHNPSENGSRTSYYGVTGVPHVVIDGNHFSGGPNQVTQSVVNQLQAIPSPMELQLAYEVDEAANTITVHVMGRASTEIEGSLKLFVGVIEKEIHFNSAPGSNGEKDFYSVMKKLLPSSSGQFLGSLKENDYFTYHFTWKLANIYDMSQLDAIAWVQNYNSKEVYQACKSSQNIEPFYANEAALSGISNVKKINCSGEAQPKVVLTNNGGNALTSAELEVSINGELLKTVAWNGNLPTFASETVDLGDISFEVESNNTLEVRIISINGGSDEVSMNDLTDFEIKGAPETVGKVLKLTIHTDNNPQETTWQITNTATGEVIQQGGPYTEANHNYNEILEITADGCYDFTIFDAGGDGLTDGQGLYGLKAGGTTLFSGGEFGSSDSNEISYEVYEGIGESQSAVNLFPNPTSGMVSIVCDGEQSVTIFNMVGQRVYEGLCNSVLKIDMKPFGAGIYAIQVGNESIRVVVK